MVEAIKNIVGVSFIRNYNQLHDFNLRKHQFEQSVLPGSEEKSSSEVL